METIGRVLREGGPVLYFLFGLSLFSLALIVWKTLRLIPVTGVPLPFLSFGGSSLVVTMGAFGILLNIARQAR